ncbi:hypothetical protein [Aquimarina algiphila]|uniref:hypothetical protein n=1 Tax=Aquimarina algiphila TaxID=2047982 RepID=UPI0023309E81|nr:hypothetical protein [Aquimarina algiphila]
MKKILCLALFLFLQVSFSQTQEDYQKIINEISEGYNAKDANKIFSVFSADLQSTFTLEKVKTFITDNQTKKGSMGGYTFLIDEDKEKRYLIEFEHSSMILILGLSKDNKITKFTLEEY